MKKFLIVLILIQILCVVVEQKINFYIGNTTTAYVLDVSYIYSGVSAIFQLNNITIYDYLYKLQQSQYQWNDFDLCYSILNLNDDISINLGLGITTLFTTNINWIDNFNIMLSIQTALGQMILEIQVPSWQFSNVSYSNYVFNVQF